MFQELAIRTRESAELVDVTEQVQVVVRQSGAREGVCHLFVPHTTAGLTLNENWDPAVRQDLLRVLAHIVPDELGYRHAEGNSAAHARALLTGFDATLLVAGGALQLGAWQGIYLAEFDGPRARRLLVQVRGDD